MNYPMQPMAAPSGMMGTSGMAAAPGMMGTPGMAQAPGMMGATPGMFAPAFPHGGLVTLDPECAPGMVTLDVGNPCCPPVGVEMHRMPEPLPTPAPEVYVVKKGDSVYKIAQRYGTTMRSIILANNLRNPDLIFPGQVLYIPGV